MPFLGKAEFGGVENINIEIEGAFHSDFSYDSANWANARYAGKSAEQAAQLKAIDQERNRKVSLFMRDLYEAAMDENDLSRFLLRPDIFRDSITGDYSINLDIYHSIRDV